MSTAPSSLQLTEEQILYFRARRGHLAGPGAADPATAAQDLLGAQAQQIAPALLALSQRTAGRPSASAIHAQMAAAPRTLVRTWGQRGTLHIYHAAADWRDFNLVQADWIVGSRRGLMPPTATVNKVRKLIEKSTKPWTRADLDGLIPAKYLQDAKEFVVAHKMAAHTSFRFAAGRILWVITLNGDASLGQKIGAEQSYVSRQQWFPKLAWPAPPPPAQKKKEIAQIGTQLARRYLSLYGAATTKDISHFLGCKVSEAKVWVADLQAKDELLQVQCGARKGLLAMANDSNDLQAKPPKAITQWPIRLLPLWDSMMMGHHDKSWTVPNDADRKRIWRSGAYVAATVIDRGRVVAIWTHKMKGKKLAVEVAPLSLWKTSRHMAGIKRELISFAKHLGVEPKTVALKLEN
ncbi:MAG: winged helix DNA-binding domain-containing protein [Planctomycetes bacterium]|nr:winged helix DNA-binding domain-containing protein [Planctomycetota bacterium]